jgi:hypothetical protein
MYISHVLYVQVVSFLIIRNLYTNLMQIWLILYHKWTNGQIWSPHHMSFYLVKNTYTDSEMLPYTEIYSPHIISLNTIKSQDQNIQFPVEKLCRCPTQNTAELTAGLPTSQDRLGICPALLVMSG